SKLAAGQADRLSIQREIELNRVPVVRVQRRLPQRAYSAISRGGDDQCGCVDAAGASHRHAEQSDSCRHRDREEVEEGARGWKTACENLYAIEKHTGAFSRGTRAKCHLLACLSSRVA